MSDPALTVVVLAPTGRDAELMCELAVREGESCSPVDSVDEVIEVIGDDFRAGVVILAEEGVSSDEAASFAAYLERQPKWSELPVILLGAGPRTPASFGALLERRESDLLRRPLQSSTMAAAIRSAVENRRRQYEIRDLVHEADQLNERLRQRAHQLRRLSLQLAEAEERERRRLAVYVHDDLQQILAGVMFHLDVTERRLGDREAAAQGLETVRELVSSAIEGTRDLSQELSPTALRRSGLTAALEWLAAHMQKLNGLEVDVDVSVEHEPRDASTATFLFRAAQELLLNVVKHAESDRAVIALRNRGERLELTIRDYGAGFDPEAVQSAEETGSFGLFSIRERAELLGGVLEIESESGKGSAVHLFVPEPSSTHVPEDGESEEMVEEEAARDGVRSARRGSRVRVVLVDDHVVVRSGLRLVLTEHPEIEVVDELGDGRKAVEAADTIQPDLMLMDVAMPNMDGIEATRLIKQRHPEIRIIGLSMFNDPDTAAKMLEAGADLYLHKAGPSEELVSAILSRDGG
ncbi:MAG: response regulator [Spirochaetota bacterium]